MKYSVTINKRYRYIKVYKTLKKINTENSNALSKAMASFVDRFILKRKVEL